MTGLEPVTSSFPRKCSTTELHRLVQLFKTALALERKTGLEPATLSLEG